MPQDYTNQYYMVVDEQSTGPYTLDELTLHPKLTPDSLVWKPGIENWVQAKTLPELTPAFSNHTNHHTPPNYSGNPYQEEQKNPDWNNRGADNFQQGNTYSQGQPHNPFANNPQYQENHTYHNRHTHYDNPYNRYDNNYRPNIRTNWLPWAIVATVLGFFTSCFGVIFGIIGIIQANKANTLYARGYEREGDAANSNARIMTIIGLVIAAICILVAFFFGGFYGGLSNFSYL